MVWLVRRELSSGEWLERVGRINLRVNRERLERLEAVARRCGLDVVDARSSKVIWRLLDDADAVYREKDRMKERLREAMEAAGIRKWEL